MLYAELAGYLERLEREPGRLGMTAILVGLLQRVQPKDMQPMVRLLQGAVAPDWEGIELGLAEKQVLKALAMATGASPKSEADLARLTEIYHEKGDIGLAAEHLLAQGRRRQASLFEAGSLTLQGVFATLQDIAATTGAGSQEGKQRLLAQMLASASPLEARYLVRTVMGRLRLGVADMTFLDALAHWHLQGPVRSVTEMEGDERERLEDVRRRLELAYDLRSDLAVVAFALAEGGMESVGRLGIRYGVPVRPMAAERLKTLPEILEKMGGRVSMEYKYDGLRIQAHVSDAGIHLFSRRLENVTSQFPDVVANLKRQLKGRACIVEGEAVALDEAGAMRPFQEIARRRGRKLDIDRMARDVPVTLMLFDLIAEGDGSVMEEPLEARRKRLARLVGGTGAATNAGLVRLSTIEEAGTAEAMEEFFARALEDGAEGVMCKDPRAPYKAGSRGFAWVKFKADYQEGMADSMDLVAVGAFHGRGRRAGWYGALLMAAFDPGTGTYPSVCKLGTGFTDEMLAGMQERFAPHLAPARPKEVLSGLEADVWFEPAIVMEVEAAELTLSPVHKAAWGLLKPGSGLAARFPRFTGRFRGDKSARQATSVEELVAMYRQRRS